MALNLEVGSMPAQAQASLSAFSIAQAKFFSDNHAMHFHREPRHHGLTLVEVLVVIAIIAVLAALLLSALANGKAQAQQTACANNIRQLSFAWFLFADDHDDFLVNNHGINETLLRRENWANNLEDLLTSDGNTNVALLKSGLLNPYLSGSTAVFKCPSDTAVAENGPRIRSVSMNSLIGDPGELTNKFNPQFIQFFRLDEITNPSHIYVFLDEHPDTLNDGFFMNRWENPVWGNLPGSWHKGGANLSFADGHVECHRWVAGETRRPFGSASGTFPVTERADFDWLKEHSSLRKN